MSEARTQDEPKTVPLEQLDDDQLRALVDGTFPAPEEDEQEPQEDASAEEQEPVEAQEDGPEDETEESEPEGDDTPSELDLLKLRVERLQAAEDRASHFQRAHDKLTGDYGRLKQELLRLQTRPATDDLSGSSGEAGYDRRESVVDSALAQRLEAMEKFQRQLQITESNRALQEEAAAFQVNFPDAKDFQEDMVPLLRERQALLSEALESADPDRVRALARDVMRDVYFTAKENKLRARMEEAEKRRAANRERLEKRKVSAGVSATGGTRVSTKKRPRSIKDLSDDELKELVDATGDTL